MMRRTESRRQKCRRESTGRRLVFQEPSREENACAVLEHGGRLGRE